VAADRLLAAAWLFGAVSILQLHAQAMGLPVPPQLMSALPQPRHRRGADRDFATGPQGAGFTGGAFVPDR
jgi:general nucleoside transport system permease protein